MNHNKPKRTDFHGLLDVLILYHTYTHDSRIAKVLKVQTLDRSFFYSLNVLHLQFEELDSQNHLLNKSSTQNGDKIALATPIFNGRSINRGINNCNVKSFSTKSEQLIGYVVAFQQTRRDVDYLRLNDTETVHLLIDQFINSAMMSSILI